MKDFLFVDLSQSLGAKQFDGMAAGEFTDMYGRIVSFKKDDLPTFVANTKAALESTRTDSGEMVGFPIDCLNHDHGLAAGWITDVELGDSGDVIRFTPKWTDLGREQIGRNITRYFSPQVDLSAKVIQGGSLTNWPASRTKEQKIMLKPIELSAAMLTNEAQSLDERLSKIRQSFYDSYGGGYSYETYPVEVFDGYLICKDEDKLYRVDYTEGDEGIQFSPKAEWVEVKQTYVEAALKAVKSWVNKAITGLLGQASDAPVNTEQPGEETEVETVDITKLTPEERQTLLAQLTSDSNPPAELAALIETKANERVTALLAAEQKKAKALDLAGKLAGGTAEAPFGLPVDKDVLAEFLQAPTAEKAEEILLAIQSKGLVDFSEHGHSRQLTGQTELPVEIAAKLDSGALSLADLASPILALGDLAQYNLSKWKKE